MKKETKQFFKDYGSIIVYAVIIMAMVIFAYVTDSWSEHTPQLIIMLMALFILTECFRKFPMEEEKKEKIRIIIMVILMVLWVAGIIVFLLYSFF